MRKKDQGYAIVVVMILLVIGTVMLIMFNRESMFYTKVAGIFNRARKIQLQALDGIELAKGDLRAVAGNSRDPSITGVDKFTVLVSGSAVDKGLKYDTGNRNILPRINRVDDEYELKVYYFPENPCLKSACTTDNQYNDTLPKRFVIVSEAINHTNGEIFTAESRLQVNIASYAEISYGILGFKCLKLGGVCTKTDPLKIPSGNATYDITPAKYDGQTYFNLPPDMLRFVLDEAAPEWQSQQHIFQDIATFRQTAASVGQDVPFKTSEWTTDYQLADGTWTDDPNKKLRPMMTFAKGFQEGVPLIDPDDPKTDPTSTDYFTKMQTIASTPGMGYDLSSSLVCPATPNEFGKRQVDVCLKFVKDKIWKYQCNTTADGFMGRIDKNIHPARAYAPSVPGFTGSDAGVFKPGMGIENTFPDRYIGEHLEVYTNTPAPKVLLGNTKGVIYCNMGSGCDCNVHIKGIIDGQVNVVSQKVVIEGDLRYQHQGEGSVDSLGVVAKTQIIIPAGIPQAATSDANTYPFMSDAEPPYTTLSQLPHAPQNLAESYLNITNFLPYDSVAGEYVDRNDDNPIYGWFTKWNLALTGDKKYGTPTALDLDGYFYAGDTLKVDGIFNPKDNSTADTAAETDNSGKTNMAMTFITCEDPPACQHHKYRDPSINSDTNPKALYKTDGTLSDSLTPGVPVQPLFWADGLQKSDMNIGQDSAHPANANYNDITFQPGEEIALPQNRLINIFGSLSSKYHFIYDQMTSGSGAPFRMGFARKMITKNKSSPFNPPPGFPTTSIIKIDELYTKNLAGKSKLVP